MTDTEKEFYRIKRLPPYVLAEVNTMKAKARAEGRDIIDFGMGNPDAPTPPHIVEKLVETVRDPRTHRYSSSRGIPGLRRANAAYYARRFGVELDPESETIVTIGSKEGLVNLAQAITTPGDVVLSPNPTYPIHSYAFIMAGAAIRHIPLTDRHDYMREIERAVRHSVPSPIALILNFPANPTARLADLDFYAEVVDFCRHHNMFIISDLAYAEVYFESGPPPSVLQVPGAKDITIELTSLSKTYSMPGWRMGFASGSRELIAALAHVKSYVDYGAFTPIQVAATAALNGPQECLDEMRERYRIRRDVLVEGLRNAGWEVPSPDATMFAWVPVPPAFADVGSLEFAKRLLTEANVAVSPGIGFGEYGENYLRVALVENVQRTRQAVRNIKTFLAASGVNSAAIDRRTAAGGKAVVS
ncbi:MAG: LL-diaminopimelate aminotransferase [Alphaproteobacteria bacterium]|nr:LL-diaminopimelate aminotransferase [Alphaproteobacteria bacterium]